MKTIRLLIGLVLLLPLCAGAQSPSAPKPVSIRFLFLDETSGDYLVKLGSEFQNLGSKPYVVSSPFVFAPGSRLELYKQLPDPKTGELVRTRVLNLTVTASPLHALAVIAPTTTASTDGTINYRARLYDVSPENTPDRSIRILNLSPSPMAARFGEDQIEISPGEERLVTPSVDKRSRIRVYVASQTNEGWNMIFNSFLSLQENTSMTGIVIYSPSGMRHTYTKDELDVLGAPSPGFFWLYFTAPTSGKAASS